MNYYLIEQDKRVKNTVAAQIGKLEDIWKSDNPFFIPVKVEKLSQYPYFLPLLDVPVYIISDQMKRVFDIYQNNTLYRPCALGLMEKKAVKVYWLMQPKIIDCLDEGTRENIIYSIDDILLSRSKIGYNKVFQIDTKMGNYLVIDEEVLEQLMRNGISAFDWIELQVAEN